jgi:uncharacterized membrane protein YqjE
MTGNHTQAPPLSTLVRKFARTGLGALQNRGELLSIEWQEEKARLAELLIATVGLLFFGIMGALMVTATIIFLFPAEQRIYAVAGFAVLYLAGAIGAWFGLKSLLKHEPFAESLAQVKKDAVWFDSLK